MAQRIRTCMRSISDMNIKEQVERCYDAVNNSSLQSYPEAEDAELDLRNAVEILCVAIENEENASIEKKVKNVILAVQNRNDVIKKCRFN